MPTRSAPQRPEGADLCGSLEAGAEDGEVDTFAERDALFGGFGLSEGAETRGVGGGHVEEALSGIGNHGKTGLVGAGGGVGAGEIDVVGDGDERALGDVGADASGGVGDDEDPAAEQAEDAGGEGDLVHRVALISVDAALHDCDWDAGNVPEDQLAGVAGDGRERPAGDVGVGDDVGAGDLGGEVAEAGAEDDADGGGELDLAADVRGGGGGSGKLIGLVWHNFYSYLSLLAN